MIGILIIAHGTLGESLIHCASHVLGSRPPQLMQIGVTTHDDPAQILPQALQPGEAARPGLAACWC